MATEERGGKNYLGGKKYLSSHLKNVHMPRFSVVSAGGAPYAFGYAC